MTAFKARGNGRRFRVANTITTIVLKKNQSINHWIKMMWDIVCVLCVYSLWEQPLFESETKQRWLLTVCSCVCGKCSVSRQPSAEFTSKAIVDWGCLFHSTFCLTFSNVIPHDSSPGSYTVCKNWANCVLINWAVGWSGNRPSSWYSDSDSLSHITPNRKNGRLE